MTEDIEPVLRPRPRASSAPAGSCTVNASSTIFAGSSWQVPRTNAKIATELFASETTVKTHSAGC